MSDLIQQFINNFKSKSSEQFKLAYPSPDFVPYVCHLDDNTILLKNTHILQSMKIVGFSREIVENSNLDIRSIIREALNKYINDPHISIWINTIRTRRNLDPGGRYNSKFARDLHSEWNKKNYWQDKYVNEVYISIVYSGSSFKIENLADLINSTNIHFLSKREFKKISANLVNLKKIVDLLCEHLKEFGIKKLGLYQNASGLNSELIEFFSKIINLEDQQRLLPIVDLSEYINDFKSAFGNNTFQITAKRNKHFSTIISLKEYHEVTNNSLNILVTLPIEMVITQTINFIDKNVAAKSFKYQDYILKVSLDYKLQDKLKYKELFTDENSKTAFGHSQTSIMITGNNLSQLNQNITRCIKVLNNIGFVAFREDLNMEDIFWSQLPGNFHFIRRKTPISFKQFGGFAILNNTTAGKTDNIWGKAVALFRTALGTPYFFNFHSNNNHGNTIIIGDSNINKTLMFNFLLSASTKYQTKILIINTNNKSKLLAGCLNAKFSLLENIEEDFNYNDNLIHLIDCQKDINNPNFHDDLMMVIYEFIKSNNKKYPLIVAIDQLDNIPNNLEFNNYLSELQKAIAKANGIFLMTNDISKNLDYANLYNEFDNRIIFTNKVNPKLLEMLKINSSEQKHISKLSESYKQFMLIKPGESVMAELNLTGINHILNILNGDEKSYEIYEQNKDKENWLNLIYQNSKK